MSTFSNTRKGAVDDSKLVNAIGYVRRSAKSEDNTVSLQEQERQIRDYCVRNQMTVVGIVSHDGISGAKRSRFDAITKAVYESEAKVLVIYNLDRLARDAAGLLDHLRLLASCGVAVHEVGQGALDLRKAVSKFTVSVRGVMDEFFRDTVAEKTRHALAYKRDNGLRYTNVAPFGFSYVEGKIVEHAEEQRALRIIAACHRKGLGARRIRHALIEAGYTGRMSLSTLHRTIKNKLPATYFADL